MKLKNELYDFYTQMLLRRKDILDNYVRLDALTKEIDRLYETKAIGSNEHKKLRAIAYDVSNVLHGRLTEIDNQLKLFKQWVSTKKKNKHS